MANCGTRKGGSGTRCFELPYFVGSPPVNAPEDPNSERDAYKRDGEMPDKEDWSERLIAKEVV